MYRASKITCTLQVTGHSRNDVLSKSVKDVYHRAFATPKEFLMAATARDPLM
jgi:hypothetical protein